MAKIKILIVEDELLIAKDISIILDKEGYESTIGVTTVADAIVALENDNFNLVLIDIKLRNDSNGIDLGDYLLKKDTIPFIYITSNSDNITMSRVKDTRPHGIIIKPYKPIDILTTVALVLNNYKHKNIDIVRSNTMNIDEVPFILKEVVKYIDNHVDGRIDIDDLANSTPWGNQHFIRVFTKYVGDTPYQYVLKKKIEKSKVLITETELPLKDIAFDLGFLSYGNFCKLFKRELGMNPDVYRKSHNVSQYLNK